jgi:RNA polymerase sigma-70 factor, ECF subfamily
LDRDGHLALLVLAAELQLFGAPPVLTVNGYIHEERLPLMTVLAKNSAKEHDNELLSAVAAGNRRALEELYLGYHRRLTRFLSRITPRYENVEEVINDTFMVVWQSAKDFRYASQVSTWIIGIAYRTALKSLRRQKHHTAARSLDDYPEQTTDPTLHTEIQDWLRHGLNQLPVEQRLTLELAYHMGHSLEEIAAITECPVGTVKARMFHAREKLRQYLPASGGGAGDMRVERE